MTTITTTTRTLIVKWTVKPSETPRIQGLLPELAEKTKAEPGNIFYSIYQSETDPNVFILHECYADAEAAERHRQSDHYQAIVVKNIIPHLVNREVITVRPLL